MKFLKALLSAFLNWLDRLTLGASLVLGLVLWFLLVAFAILVVDVPALPVEPLPTPVPSPSPSIPSRLITDPDELAALDDEFGDLTYFGYTSDHVYRRGDLLSEQTDPGRGPLHQMRGYRLLIGKTGKVLVIAYEVTNEGESSIVTDPQDGTQIYLALLEGYTAPETWWNRPVASAWVENDTLDGWHFLELSLWSPWLGTLSPDPPDFEQERQSFLWYWNGEAYIKYDRDISALVIHDGTIDFATLYKPSSP